MDCKLKFIYHTCIMKKINVLILDDHSIVMEGIVKRINKVFDNVECRFTDNVRNATAILHQNEIDILISDLELGMNEDEDGFTFIIYQKKVNPKLKSIAFTNYNSYRIMKKAESVGFNSFLDKSCSENDFMNTLRQVYTNSADQVYYSQSMKELRSKKNVFYRNIFTESFYGINDLSDREAELTLLSVKTTDKHKLSEMMQIHHTTVDTHFKHALAKLHLSHRKELALFAEEFADEIMKLLKK